MRQEVPIVGGYGKDVDLHLSAEDTLNWLPVRSESPGARSQFMLRQAPGLRPLTQIGTGPIRGLHTVEGRLYAVSGTQLYEVTNSYVGIPRGTIPGVGRVSMAHNQRGTGNELAVDNGSARYVLNTATLAFQKVTDAGFPGSFIAFYVDQYLGFVEPQGRYWGHSDLADALSYNTLDQYEAEGDPDRIVSAYVSHREVLIFGKETIEPFVNTGGSTGTFERASNTVIENGCSSRYGVAGMDNSVFWPDDKRILRRLDGYTAVRFSTAAEEALLAECTDSEIKRAYAFTWEDKGHKVYYLTVPGKFTLGYDLLSGQFHRRSSPGLNTWRINSLAFWNGVWVGGDMQSGSLYALDWNYHYDGQEELVRERITGALTKEQVRLLVSEIELVFGTGGPSSAADEFTPQPTGPSITGNAPSGAVGDAYSYAYTVTGGDAPLLVSLWSGTLPDGLTLSSAGVLSGTPTTVGSYSWSVRVTDANGLYDDLADTANVTNTTWFAGPVLVAADPAYYRKAGSPAALISATPIALPAQGSGALRRISVANGKVFFHRDTTACVSSDRGATWTACDNSLWGSSWARDVYWNGTKYYYGGVTSTDGVTWTAIPNLPSGGRVQLARTSDGLIVVQTADGVFHTSINAGATWTARADFGSSYTSAIATDGARISAASSGGFIYYSDDLLQTILGADPGSAFGSYYANGAFHAFFDDAIEEVIGLARSVAGATWPNTGSGGALPQFFVPGFDLNFNTLGHDPTGNMAACYSFANVTTVYASTDSGVTWVSVGTISGDVASLAGMSA